MRNDYKVTMEINGLKAVFNMPKAREKQKDAKGNELAQGLPEYNQRPAFVVDEYPACPSSWMHGSGNSASYFVPVVPEHGMWLDFTQNMHYSPNGKDYYDVAVVPSIQGINPITGTKSDPIRLEQYREMCPKHQKEFKQDLFCEECKYRHHPQNYLASNTGSDFWLDGFRTEDGTIRQWYFTEDECKGVAAQIIGDERVFAIGLAFYIAKQPKPATQFTTVYSNYPYVTSPYSTAYNYDVMVGATYMCASSSPETMSASTNKLTNKIKTSARVTRGSVMDSLKIQANVESSQKLLEIGAGAKISQKINRDPQDLSYWGEEPAGFIYINYCDVETAEKIIAAGKRQEAEEGFLAGLDTK